MLPHYVVKLFGTRNCHVYEMSETVWHERLKLSCKIQSFKDNRWKSTVLRCEHYLINWQNIFAMSILYNPQNDRLYASVLSASRKTAFALEHQYAINFLACNFANVHRFHFFTGRLSNKFVKKTWLLKISPHLKCVATLPCDLSLIMTLVRKCRLLSDIGVFKVV